MYCLANICYVCLEKKNKLISNITSSSAVNKDFIDIIAYRPFNLVWLKTKRIILICEECCLRLRETYQFLKMCNKNSALLQDYMNNLINITRENTDSEAELTVMLDLNIEHNNIHEVKCEMPEEQMHTLQVEPIIEDTQDVFVDFGDFVVIKKENIYAEEEVDVIGEYPMDINSTEVSVNSSNAHITNTDCVSSGITCEQDVFVDFEDFVIVKKENIYEEEEVDVIGEYPMDINSTETSVNSSNAHITNTDRVSSGFTCKQVHATNKKKLKTVAKKSCICTICSKSFVSNSALKNHTRIHTGEKPYQCTKCKTRFSQKNYLKNHTRVHTGEKPYQCTKCQTWFSQQHHLKYHMLTHTGEKPYKCSICEKCFSQQSTLTCHIRTHTGEKPFECLECGRCFKKISDLHRHKLVHTGEKNHTCSICKKCFGQKSDLVKHVRIHTGEKNHACAICKKCFGRKSDLVNHVRIHTGEKNHACAICKKCFGRKSDLVKHVRIHTGEKNHTCSICKKCFGQKSDLVNHVRIHTGEKKHTCSICKKCFGRKSYLVNHMRTHTVEKSYE